MEFTLRHEIELPDSISLALAPDGRWLAITGSDGKLHVFATETLEEVEVIHVGRSPKALCFSPDGQRVVAGSRGLTAWATGTWKKTHTYKGHRRKVACAVFSPDGTRICGGGHSDVSPSDTTVRTWDVETGTQTNAWTAYGSVCALAWSPGGQKIAVATLSGQTMLLDATTLAPLWTDPPEIRTSALAFTPGGQLLGTLDQALLFEIDQKTAKVSPLAPAMRYGISISVAPDGSTAFVLCGSGGHPEGGLVAALALPSGEQLWAAPLPPSVHPIGLAFDALAGRLYVAHDRPKRLLVYERLGGAMAGS